MRSLGRALWLSFLICLLTLAQVNGDEARIPPPQGLVSDFAEILADSTRQQLTTLLQELKEKTSAEIAVVTVNTTQPLSTFDYAMKIADAWKPGAKGKDNGVVFLVAVKDRKMFIVTGYGVEGALPDGKVGAIQDQYIIPAFRRGDYAQGVLEGVRVIASVVAQEYGVTLTGTPSYSIDSRGNGVGEFDPKFVLLIAFILFAVLLASFTGSRRSRYTRFGGGLPFGRGFGGGGFGGGGGGFGGFGGGGFGGGGAGRDW